MNNLENTQNSSSYEQKKNNGKGVFYGVIAVATLIVAIIGATFAYFTATNNSSAEALKATAAVVEVNYLEGRQLVATNLVPAAASVVTTAYGYPTAYELNIQRGCTHKNADSDDSNNVNEANPESTTVSASWTCPTGVTAVSTGDVGTKCVDSNGYYVCAVYQFTVMNKSNVKQSLQSYMYINNNSFTTVDSAGAAAGKTVITDAAENETLNRALKFMTVRSATLIDTTAISSVSDPTACANNLYTAQATQSVKSTRFCNASGGADTQLPTFTDSSGSYYYFNTTAVRQSLQDADTTQTVFSNEILPSIDEEYLAGGQILYMHTVSQGTNDVTEFGPSDNLTKITNGSVVADTNGYVYEADTENNLDAMAVCQRDKTFNARCVNAYLSTSSQASGDSDTVLGAYNQVARTYYIVAWLEENNTGDTYTDAAGKKITQDADQGKSFATTINVTSAGTGSSGITGQINGTSQNNGG